MCIVMYVLLQYTVLQQFEVLQLQNHFDQQVAVCFSIFHCFVLFCFSNQKSQCIIYKEGYIYNVLLLIFMLAMKIFSGVS